MQKFAEKCPDLIMLSLGTNEAHGMGYRPEQHEVQLNNFSNVCARLAPMLSFC